MFAARRSSSRSALASVRTVRKTRQTCLTPRACVPLLSLCVLTDPRSWARCLPRVSRCVCEKLGLKPTATAGTYAALLETATALDGATRGGHADACTFFADILGADDDASADVFIATAEGMFCHGAQE